MKNKEQKKVETTWLGPHGHPCWGEKEPGMLSIEPRTVLLFGDFMNGCTVSDIWRFMDIDVSFSLLIWELV